MPTVCLSVDSATAAASTAHTDYVKGIVSFLNEGDVDVRMLHMENGIGEGAPSAATVLSDGILLAANNGNQVQLQELENGYRPDWFYFTSVPVGETPTSGRVNLVF